MWTQTLQWSSGAFFTVAGIALLFWRSLSTGHTKPGIISPNDSDLLKGLTRKLQDGDAVRYHGR